MFWEFSPVTKLTLTFQDEASHDTVLLGSDAEIKWISHLLQLSEDWLKQALTTKVTVSPLSVFTIHECKWSWHCSKWNKWIIYITLNLIREKTLTWIKIWLFIIKYKNKIQLYTNWLLRIFYFKSHCMIIIFFFINCQVKIH